MLSLLYTLGKYALGYKTSDENITDINEALAHIQNARDGENPEIEEIEPSSKEGCYYKTGCITFVSHDHILIDDRYFCDASNTLIGNLQVGTKVSYLAYQIKDNEEERVSKIISVVDDTWDDTFISDTCSTKKDIFKRNIIGKVTERDGRRVFIEPQNISFSLDKVDSEFIPLVGDWLKLEALVEINETSTDLTGEVLQVDKIQPLRSRLDIGFITTYDPLKKVGVIQKHTIFSKSACESGYIPCIGDKVVSDNIESDQGMYHWRSIRLVPLIKVLPDKSSPSMLDIHQSDIATLIENKCGIIITSTLKCDLNVQEEKEIVVSIQNTCASAHILQGGTFQSNKAETQLTLMWPSTDTVTMLNPSEAMSYIFKCKPKFVGQSKELFVFDFKDFKIGRVFDINVKALNVTTKTDSNNCTRQSNCNFRQDNWDDSLYIPGIRPCKPPAFIKVRNTVFKIPQHYWNIILKVNAERKSQMETEVLVGNAIPCLLKSLSFENYRDRFHALLYLEELAQILNLQLYDIESTSMKRSGEYIVLHVEGLAEKRPSLLVGDRAIVSFKWDSTQGQLKYEGFIHKVLSTEVYLKFSQKFHQEYNGQDCQVTFKASNSSIQRCHNALNLAVSYLGRQFLFPTHVVEKDPQLYLEDTPKEEKPSHRQRKRNESDSSISSGTTSTSEGSNNATGKSSVKKSVAERLFNVKPIQSTNATKDTVFVTSTKQNINTNEPSGVQQRNGGNKTTINKELHRKDEKVEEYLSQIKKRSITWVNKDLNYYQKEAIRNILKGVARPLPYVIFGPPGTGKTMTLCETILQILITMPESRLLVATPSNSSANLLSERLLDSGILKPGDLVRLIAHHCLESNTIPERLLPYCATAELAAPGTRNTFKTTGEGPRINCTMGVLGRHRITVGTCIALGILRNIGFPRGHFTHVLVDEAGQATEPEILIPLTFIQADSGQVVLAGDPQQLGPVVQSRVAGYYGLGESFLSRLLHQFPYQRDTEGFEDCCYDPRLVTKLVMNYRSLPEILELPNSLFYDSELLPQISLKKSKEASLLKLLSPELPAREGNPPAIVFHGVEGTNLKDNDNPSWYNPEEATQVYLYILRLYKYELTADDIGIITPYQKQVHKIRDLLLELDVEAPKVSSVEGFQGQERNVIILSTVRSCGSLVKEDIKHALGFIASPKRLNVAITRARALLIIIGNPQLLVQDPYWRSVLIYCIDHGAYTGCSFTSSHIHNSLVNFDEVVD